MSHFTVVVIGSDIDEQLAPYAEQDADPQYLKFQDMEDEYLEEYNNKEVEIVVLTDGTLHNKYEDQFRSYDSKTLRNESVYPEGAILRNGKFSELYSTFDDFVAGWHGTETRDEKVNRYGYWHNPKAKWDWYSVGGRWSGFFRTKKGAAGEIGEPGVFKNVPKKGYVDTCMLKNIDIEAMMADAVKEANETYDKLEEVLKGRSLPSWNAIREKHGEKIDDARNEYNNLEIVKELNMAKFWAMGDLVESFGPDRTAYIARCKKQTMVPFAVVKDGEWFEKGEMGWFGMSHNEMSEDDWNQNFWDMINSLDPETQLTLMDCHI